MNNYWSSWPPHEFTRRNDIVVRYEPQVKAGGILDVFIDAPGIVAVDVGFENNVRFPPNLIIT